MTGIVLPGNPARADRNGDEDETFYAVVVEPSFRNFHRKYGRYPRSWIELNIQDACWGFQLTERKHFPKADEAVTWRPARCELAYRIVHSDRKRFKIAALKDGHVVSIYENYKATFLKTPYHDHNPWANAPNEQD